MVMKTLTIILTLLLGTTAVLGVIALPPANGTNDLAVLRASQQTRKTVERSYAAGQITELERQTNRLEIEVILLAVAVGAVGTTLILLMRPNLRYEVRSDRLVEDSQANK